MSENKKNTTEKRRATRVLPLLAIALFVLATFSALIYASKTSGSSVPQVELDSHFDLADKNKDGVVTKEEFQSYLEARQAAATAKNTYVRSAQSSVKICPNSGQPCSGGGCGEGSCSQDKGEARASGGCCKDKGEAKASGGCCKDKGEAKAAGGCCKEKGEAKASSGCCKDKGEAKAVGGCCKEKGETQAETPAAETTQPAVVSEK